MKQELRALDCELKKIKGLRKDIDKAFTVDPVKNKVYSRMIKRSELRINVYKLQIETGEVYIDNECYEKSMNEIRREKNAINLLEHILLSHDEFNAIKSLEIG
ncbi:MAG: hypothetical protein HRT72_02755 [Flavobacteriales bacterium]|nr:hypothetical protein [Flavobacteriales bacterium]